MQHPMTRRRLLGRGVAAALGGAGVALLTACGGAAPATIAAASTAATPGAATRPAGSSSPAVTSTATSVATSAARPAGAGSSTASAVTTTPAAAGRAAGAAVSLRFMNRGGTEVYPVHQQVIDAFEAATPGIRVAADPVTQGSWQEKFTAAIVGGTAPDVVMESADTYRPFAKAGQLVPLDPYLARDNVNPADFLEVAVASHQYHGKLYAWNYNGGTYATFYNPGLLGDVGLAKPTGAWTWDEYVADVTKLTKYRNPGDPSAGVAVYGTTDLPGWDYFATLDGAELFSKDGTHANFGDPKVLARIDWQAGLMAKRLVPSPRFKDTPAPAFYSQTVALWTVGYWNVARARVDAKFPWDAAAIPTATAGKRTTTGWYSGNAIATASAHRDQSWAFVQFFGGAPGQRLLTEGGLTMPAVKALADADVFLKSVPPDNERAFITYDAWYVPYWMHVTDVPAFNQVLNPALNKVWLGQATAHDAITPIVPLLDQVLARN